MRWPRPTYRTLDVVLGLALATYSLYDVLGSKALAFSVGLLLLTPNERRDR